MLVAAGCGAETLPADGDGGAERTTSAWTARIETVLRISVGGGSEDHEFRLTEVVDYANDRGISVEAETGCRTITIGDVSYWELARDERMPPGTRWVKSKPEAVGAESTLEEREEVTTSGDGTITFSTWSTSVGVAIPEPGPAEYLDYLREHSDHVDHVGEDEVRGVPTTHYRAMLDVRRVLRLQLEESGSSAADIDRFVDDVADTTEEIEVWVDAEGLLRRLVTTTSSADPDGGAPDRTVTTTDYLDYGIEVEVEPPPADEVIGSQEWLRLTEQRSREELDEWSKGIDERLAPLPESFDPAVASTCLD